MGTYLWGFRALSFRSFRLGFVRAGGLCGLGFGQFKNEVLKLVYVSGNDTKIISAVSARLRSLLSMDSL